MFSNVSLLKTTSVMALAALSLSIVGCAQNTGSGQPLPISPSRNGVPPTERLNALSSGAQSYKVLYSFTGGPDGGSPDSTLVRDAAGNLYGTTLDGGDSNCGQLFSGKRYGCGVVFKLSPLGTETVLHTFSGADGEIPRAGLIRDAAGNLYGTTTLGGSKCYRKLHCGVVFKIDPSGNETTLYRFTGPDGASPAGSLVRDAAGNLYGTTQYGGNPNTAGCGNSLGYLGCGTAFKLEPNGKETVLQSFYTYSTGVFVQGALVRDAAGNLYGATSGGGDTGPTCGVVFKLSLSGREKLLYSFACNPNADTPSAGLLRNGAGDLFGVTEYGGSKVGSGYGTVYEVDRSGKEHLLHSFRGPDGTDPQDGLTADARGNLYGTAFGGGSIRPPCGTGCGTVFRISPSGTFTILYKFTNRNGDGAFPVGGLIRDAAGNLYGTTQNGGAYKRGTVFRLKP